MLKTFALFTLLLTISLGFVSCGGGLSTSGKLSAEQAPTVVNQFKQSLAAIKLGSAPSMATGAPTGVTTSSVSALTTSPLDACMSSTPTTTVDADGDGIAATKKYIFNCNDVLDSGYYRTYKGTILVEDTDDTKKWALGGYRFTYDASFSSVSSTHKDSTELSGYWDLEKQGSSYVYNADFTSKFYESNPGYDVQDYLYRGQWNIVITPTSESTPWTAGTQKINGNYQFDGQLSMETAPGNYKTVNGSVVLSYKSQNLVYKSTCAQFYESGSIALNDASGNKIVITYSCTTSSTTYNGTAI